jgi:hypothetical protein
VLHGIGILNVSFVEDDALLHVVYRARIAAPALKRMDLNAGHGHQVFRECASYWACDSRYEDPHVSLFPIAFARPVGMLAGEDRARQAGGFDTSNE